VKTCHCGHGIVWMSTLCMWVHVDTFLAECASPRTSGCMGFLHIMYLRRSVASPSWRTPKRATPSDATPGMLLRIGMTEVDAVADANNPESNRQATRRGFWANEFQLGNVQSGPIGPCQR
jgi:hypothetical protein